MNHFIDILNAVKCFGNNTVLDHISLEINKGELVTLLGPSGCGKSTLLRAIAGLNSLEQGEIWIDGQNMTNVDVRKRQVGMVFQSYALFPNMTAAQNVAFGLAIQKQPKDQIQKRVSDMLDMVGLKGKENQRPSQLSGGQQQRVALARALVMDPKVLLLDEPLSALDAQIRQTLRVQIREIQQATQITAIFVTHDQEEAMSISDRVFVMHQGVIMQNGSPRDIYKNPNSEFVARFIGHYNVLSPEDAGRLLGISIPACKVVAIRPEVISLYGGENLYTFTGKITQVSMLGSIIRCQLNCKGITVQAETVNHDTWQLVPGETVTAYIHQKDLVFI